MSQRRVVVTIVVLIILLITLTPSANRTLQPFSFCLGCGPRSLADGILNLCLFVPLGIVLGWNSRSPATAILSGFLLSTAIELTQLIVPGRDPSLSDILFNTVGTAAGVFVARRPFAWLLPDRGSALKLMVSSIATVALVMIGTVLLLSPASPSFFIARSGNDLLLRYRTRASGLGLDEPDYRIQEAWRGKSDTGRISSVNHHRSRWDIEIGGTRTATLGPTVGQGWTLLEYPDAIARRLGRVVNALWIAAICFPIGFWARGQLLAIAAALLALLLTLIPALTGVATTSVEEWAGAGLGLLAGAALGLLSTRLARTHRLNRNPHSS